MAFFNHDSHRGFPSRVRLGALFFLWMLISNCATQKIIGNEFVHSNKGYAFVLPGADWEVDGDAWRYERDFGYLLVREKPRPKSIRRSPSRNGPKPNDLDIRPLPGKKIEKLLLDMDTGFRHKTHAGKILVGTIVEGNLIKFIKGNFTKTDSDLPKNLIRGYMERLRWFYPPQEAEPQDVTVRTLAQSGQAYRMQWIEGRDIRIMYGISLYKEILLISLKVDREAPRSAVEEGSKALDRLVESVRVLTAE